MPDIQQKFIINNRTPYKDRKIEYIVIHDTGNTDNGANAEFHYRYFNTEGVNASADFVVDDRTIIQTVDYTQYFSWHCGDGHGHYGITNFNSIGVEICVNKDGDYNSSVSNALELVKIKMQELGLSADQVVRHYDASRKLCPYCMSHNDWAGWKAFKQNLISGRNANLDREINQILNQKAPGDGVC